MHRSGKKHILLLATVAILIAINVTVRAQSEGFELGLSGEPANDVSSDSQEFDRFVNALREIQSIQNKGAAEMDRVFATSTLNERRFRELHRRMQSPEKEVRDQLGDKEKEQYAELLTEINEIQRDTQAEMVEAIQDQGLTVERFNALILAVREEPTLQQAIQQRLQN